MRVSPEPIPADPAAFGRPRDDRAALLFAASFAVLLHVLAVFIPLPPAAQPDLPPAEPPLVRIGPVVLVPPELPEPPPLEKKPPVEQQKLLPLPAVLDPVRLDEPDTSIDTPGDLVDIPLDWSLGEIESPQLPADGIVDVGVRGLSLPVGILLPEPEFPELARQMRRGGKVVLRAVVDREGRVTDIEVLFVTHPDLGYSAKAIEAVSSWRYQPGELNGRVVAVRLTVNVEFNLH